MGEGGFEQSRCDFGGSRIEHGPQRSKVQYIDLVYKVNIRRAGRVIDSYTHAGNTRKAEPSKNSSTSSLLAG